MLACSPHSSRYHSRFSSIAHGRVGGFRLRGQVAATAGQSQAVSRKDVTIVPALSRFVQLSQYTSAYSLVVQYCSESSRHRYWKKKRWNPEQKASTSSSIWQCGLNWHNKRAMTELISASSIRPLGLVEQSDQVRKASESCLQASKKNEFWVASGSTWVT